MARKPNYDFEKRKKEQERKAKKDAKRADRQARRDEARAAGLDPDLMPLDGEHEAGGDGDATLDRADGAEDGPPAA